jgi:hypothetical protein
VVTRLAPNKLTVNTAAPPAQTQRAHLKMSFWLSAIPIQNGSLNLKIARILDCEPGKGLFKENLTSVTR